MAFNTVGTWYNSFLNRDPTAQEHSYWTTQLAQNGDAALDQFLQQAQQERPLSSLTDWQRKIYDGTVSSLKSPGDPNVLTNIIGNNPVSRYEDISQALYDAIPDVNNDRAAFDAKWKQAFDTGGTAGLAKALQDESKHQNLLLMQGANRRPDGPDNSFGSFIKEAAPIVSIPFLAGAAVNGLGALGLGGAGSGAAAAPAATGGLGGLGSVGGSLSSAWSALPGAAQSALTSMGVKGAMNVVTGQPLTSGLLQAGLMSGLGSVGAGFIGPTVGEGLSALGFSPETVASLVKPVTTGLIGTGTGLVRGQGLGKSLLNGIQSGTISYAGDKLNGFLGQQGFNKPTQDILSGAGKGAISSVVRGKDPLAGIVGGATQGAFNYGAGMLGSINQPEVSSPSKGIMSDESDDDYFSVDGTDWLSKIENDYSDPFNFRNDNFTDYGNPYEPYTMNDSYSDAFPDMYHYQADEPDTGNSALDAFLKQLGGGVGSAVGGAVSGGGGNSFVDKLMKQLGGLGDKAGQNPLAAIAAALGAAGSLRNAFGGAPNNLGMVDALMAKGAQQMNTPAVLPHGNITARDPRLFTQNYAADNTPTQAAPQGPDYHNQVNTLYQSVLGRAPDAAGEQYWIQQMQNGMSLPQVMQYLSQSSEKNPHAGAVMTGGLGQI